MFTFDPLKHLKNKRFLTFSGGSKRTLKRKGLMKFLRSCPGVNKWPPHSSKTKILDRDKVKFDRPQIRPLEEGIKEGIKNKWKWGIKVKCAPQNMSYLGGIPTTFRKEAGVNYEYTYHLYYHNLYISRSFIMHPPAAFGSAVVMPKNPPPGDGKRLLTLNISWNMKLSKSYNNFDLIWSSVFFFAGVTTFCFVYFTCFFFSNSTLIISWFILC